MPLTDAQRTRYTAMFNLLDVDKSGEISATEYVGGLKELGFCGDNKELAEKYMAQDKDGNMHLTLTEYLDNFEKMNEDDLMEVELRVEFRDLDQDESGELSKDECKTLLTRRNVNLKPEIFERWFAAYDKDGSGSLSYNEALRELIRVIKANKK